MFFDLLPPNWIVVLGGAGEKLSEICLTAPDGRSARLNVVTRRQVAPRDVSNLLGRIERRTGPLLLVAPFLGPRTCELLTEGGASYADATGNFRLALDDPAVFILTQGADRDPARRPRALRSLKGAAAGRVVRALCDLPPPYGVRALAELSATPAASVSRVVGLLDEEALLGRDERKRIVRADRAGLVRRWARDYDVGTSNGRFACIDPRGLGALIPKLERLDRYAVTGSLAGSGVAPARLAAVYVDDATTAAKTLELEPTDVGANVWLLEPFDGVVFERTVEKSIRGTSVVIAALSQIAVDLLTGPGREPEVGAALLSRMEAETDV